MTRKLRVLLLGQNPACASPTPESAFENTRSGKLLCEWCKVLGDHDYVLRNTVLYQTVRNRTPRLSEVDIDDLRLRIALCQADVIVAVGALAHSALLSANIDHHRLPHPSGLNRQLNDPMYVAEQLTELAHVLDKAARLL